MFKFTLELISTLEIQYWVVCSPLLVQLLIIFFFHYFEKPAGQLGD